MTPHEKAHWLADKIGALGDYAREAAQVLRRQADELAAANERIKELEAKADKYYAGWERECAAFAADREVSDKLEKALQFLLEWGHCAEANDKARAALAEVAAIRAKEWDAEVASSRARARLEGGS